MKNENVVGLLLISYFFFFSFFVLCMQEHRDKEISIGAFLLSLKIHYHERYHRSKQRTVYELDSLSFDNWTMKF